MKYFVLSLAVWICTATLPAQDNRAYVIYDAKGKEVDFDKMVRKMDDQDIVFFGEHHDNPICHWLELKLTQALHEKWGDKTVLAMEMFEADNQLIINEYMLNLIKTDNFEKEVRLWPNYRTDYKPLLEFARENGLKMVASNIPRRYASMVSRSGVESLNNLPELSKQYIADLPIAIDTSLNCYRMMLQMSEGNMDFAYAQAVKDATMAQFTLLNMEEGDRCIHFNGAFHSDNHEGICWYMTKARPDIKICTITTVSQADISKLSAENKGIADYIICVPEDMTSTH